MWGSFEALNSGFLAEFAAEVATLEAALAKLRGDRVSQQIIGGSVFQRHAILRPPMNIAGEGFDQMVGGKDLASLIENQRREAESGECFAANSINPAAKVVITTIQRLYSMLKGETAFDAGNEEDSAFDSAMPWQGEPPDVVYNTGIPPEFFDFIIVDECHRSIYELWSQVVLISTHLSSASPRRPPARPSDFSIRISSCNTATMRR